MSSKVRTPNKLIVTVKKYLKKDKGSNMRGRSKCSVQACPDLERGGKEMENWRRKGR